MSAQPFTLHPRLAADCVILGDLPLCRVLLMNDSQYPWVILVPRRADLREIYELDAADRGQLMAESCRLAEGMMQLFSGEKCNVAALGNQVPQLHIHHIVRRSDDAAWPRPVWGALPSIPYSAEENEQRVQSLRSMLGLTGAV